MFRGIIFDIDGVLEYQGRAYPGAVEDVIYTGSKRRLVLRLAAGPTLKVDTPAGQSGDYRPGEQVWVTWPGHKAYVLP